MSQKLLIDADITGIAEGTPTATDTIEGIVELATILEVIAGTDTERAVTPAGVKAAIDNIPEVTVLQASETNKGIIELATTAEVTTGTDTERAVTPAGLKYALDNLPEVTLPSATTSVKGIVQLSSATNSTSDTLAATSSAVKSAYDKGEEALTIANSKATLLQVQTEISNLVDSAPATLDTLSELATALGDDPNFATTITNQLASMSDLINDSQSDVDGKVSKSGDTMTGDLKLPSMTLDNVTVNIIDDSGRKKMTFTF